AYILSTDETLPQKLDYRKITQEGSDSPYIGEDYTLTLKKEYFDINKATYLHIFAYINVPSSKVKQVLKLEYPLSLRFNGKELHIVEWGKVKKDKSFKLHALNLSNPKETIAESQHYKVKLENLPMTIKPQESYRLHITNRKNSNKATLTNHNTQNIINAEIFIDDDFCEPINILQNYKNEYRVDDVRLEVGYESELLWIAIAKKELGVLEIKGNIHNPRIIEYHSTTGKFKDDETAWCSSFVNWVMTQAGIKGTNSAAARSWKDWGQKLDKPAYGCIGVHIKPNGYGHVGFIVGKTENGYLVSLGGNQNDSVKHTAYSKNFFQYFVYPKEYVPNYTLPTLNSNTINKGEKTR
ncbi:NlpC/P60 family protein, partial [Helicobacter cinaedi]